MVCSMNLEFILCVLFLRKNISERNDSFMWCCAVEGEYSAPLLESSNLDMASLKDLNGIAPRRTEPFQLH